VAYYCGGCAGSSNLVPLQSSPSLTGHAGRAQGALCLAPYAPLPPPWFFCRFDVNSVLLGVAGWLAAAVLSDATWRLSLLVLRKLPQLVTARSNPPGLPVPQRRLPGDREYSMRVVKLGMPSELPSVVLAPLGEEVFFRGFLLPVLATAMPLAAAVAASSFLFAMAHIQRRDYDLVHSTSWYTGFGVLMSCLTLVGHGNLAAPIVAHALFNAGMVVDQYTVDVLVLAGKWRAFVEWFAEYVAELDAKNPDFRPQLSAELQRFVSNMLAERSRLAALHSEGACADAPPDEEQAAAGAGDRAIERGAFS
jgi:membrane protease YdiL (CAAX protease family)